MWVEADWIRRVSRVNCTTLQDPTSSSSPIYSPLQQYSLRDAHKMALPHAPGLTPNEIGFLAEMELVTVIPRQKLDRIELLGVST